VDDVAGMRGLDEVAGMRGLDEDDWIRLISSAESWIVFFF
jgi:hypothetical protein